MRFDTITLAAGAADMPDPRVAPASVPFDAIKETPKTLVSTDELPTTCVLTLEGTTGQDATVQAYLLDEPAAGSDPFPANVHAGDASRLFYQAGEAVTVVVGVVSLTRAWPGKVYYRVTSAPAAASVLKIGFKSGDPYSAPAP